MFQSIRSLFILFILVELSISISYIYPTTTNTFSAQDQSGSNCRWMGVASSSNTLTFSFDTSSIIGLQANLTFNYRPVTTASNYNCYLMNLDLTNWTAPYLSLNNSIPQTVIRTGITITSATTIGTFTYGSGNCVISSSYPTNPCPSGSASDYLGNTLPSIYLSYTVPAIGKLYPTNHTGGGSASDEGGSVCEWIGINSPASPNVTFNFNTASIIGSLVNFTFNYRTTSSTPYEYCVGMSLDFPPWTAPFDSLTYVSPRKVVITGILISSSFTSLTFRKPNTGWCVFTSNATTGPCPSPTPNNPTGNSYFEIYLSYIPPTPSPTPIPTPIPTPQPTPTPTPVPTPVPTPMPTPVPTPMPTPIPIPTPQPTPVTSPNPTPNPTPKSSSQPISNSPLSSQSTGNNSTAIGIVIGVVVVALCLITIAIIVVILFLRSSKKQQKRRNSISMEATTSSASPSTPKSKSTGKENVEVTRFSEMPNKDRKSQRELEDYDNIPKKVEDPKPENSSTTATITTPYTELGQLKSDLENKGTTPYIEIGQLGNKEEKEGKRDSKYNYDNVPGFSESNVKPKIPNYDNVPPGVLVSKDEKTKDIPKPKQEMYDNIPAGVVAKEQPKAQVDELAKFRSKLGDDFVLTGIKKTDKKLGAGQFGEVWLGEWLGRKVALKTLNKEKENLSSFVEEVSLARKLNSPSVIRVFGVSLIEGSIFAVMEYCENGSLIDYLKENQISEEKMLKISLDAALSLLPLESNKIVHRDIAARNFLLDSGLNVKLNDFGLARKLQAESNEYNQQSDETKLPVRWCAPEVWELRRFTHASDLYAFGICLWEIFTRGGVPFPKQTNLELMKMFQNNQIPKLPQTTIPDDIFKIIGELTATSPDKRIPISEVILKLKEAAKTRGFDLEK